MAALLKGMPLVDTPLMASDPRALLQLLQVVDSSFPTGGFAFSHGLEWLVQRRFVTGEQTLGEALATYIDQACGGQALPSALRAMRARSAVEVCRADDWLDASIASATEREAGRAMGERFLAGVMDTFEVGERTRALALGVRAGTTPGQYPVAFGAFAADRAVPEGSALTGLAFGMMLSVTQAAVRLNLIGQAAALRVAAAAAPALDEVVARTLVSTPRRVGAFAPGLDVAGLLHRRLPFRMFAS